MKLTKATLNTINIHNPHNLRKAGGGQIVIVYNPAVIGRMARFAKWRVIEIKGGVDSLGLWGSYRCQTFDVCHRKQKEPQRLAALAWATENYEIAEWVRDPFGGYQEAAVIEKVKEIIKQGKLEA
jgi:hypothetical protein